MPAKKSTGRRPAARKNAASESDRYLPPQYQNQPQPYYQGRQSGNQGAIAVLAVLLIVALLAVCALCFVFIVKPRLAAAPAESSDESEESGTIAPKPENYQIPLGIQVPSAAETQAQDNSPTANWQSYTWIIGASTTPSAKASSSSSTAATSTAKAAPTSTLELKYPAGWVLTKSNNTIKLTNKLFADAQIIITSDASSKKLTEYLKELDEVSATAYEGKPSIQVKSQNALGTNSDKISAVQRMQYLTAADMQEKITYISYQGQIISVGLIAPQLTDEAIQLYDLLLSSFKLN